MKKKLLAMLLAVVLAVGLLPGVAWADIPGTAWAGTPYAVTGGNIYYYVEHPKHWDEELGDWVVDGNPIVWISLCDPEVTEAIIPSFLDGAPVTGIDVNAFQDCSNLTSVSIPNGVTSIGLGAFYGCTGLTSITIPDSVTYIGSWAFTGCSNLTSITLPDNARFNESTFVGCTSVEYFSVSENNQEYSTVDGVLFNKEGTALLYYPPANPRETYTIPDGVTSFGSIGMMGGAFSHCNNLTSVIIPDSVTKIGDLAFSYAKGLVSVTIPDSVTSIGYWAFRGCDSLTDIYYGGSKSQWTDISIDEDNEELAGITIHYADTEPEPTDPEPTEPDPTEPEPTEPEPTEPEPTEPKPTEPKPTEPEPTEPEPTEPEPTEPEPTEPEPTEPEPTEPEPTEPEPTEPEPKITFSDVKADDWFADTVTAAVERGLIEGDNGKFSPKDDLTRASAFIILGRLAGADVEGGSPWYQKAVDWAKSEGITDGNDPGGKITREQLAVMLWRYTGRPDANASGLDKFSDSSDIHNWDDFREAMAWAVEEKIVQGDGGRLNPLGTASRAEAVTMIMRYVDPDTFV